MTYDICVHVGRTLPVVNTDKMGEIGTYHPAGEDNEPGDRWCL